MFKWTKNWFVNILTIISAIKRLCNSCNRLLLMEHQYIILRLYTVLFKCHLSAIGIKRRFSSRLLTPLFIKTLCITLYSVHRTVTYKLKYTDFSFWIVLYIYFVPAAINLAFSSSSHILKKYQFYNRIRSNHILNNFNFNECLKLLT